MSNTYKFQTCVNIKNPEYDLHKENQIALLPLTNKRNWIMITTGNRFTE
jgi:hypothetical protein